jgi:hypothetical protein
MPLHRLDFLVFFKGTQQTHLINTVAMLSSDPDQDEVFAAVQRYADFRLGRNSWRLVNDENGHCVMTSIIPRHPEHAPAQKDGPKKDGRQE